MVDSEPEVKPLPSDDSESHVRHRCNLPAMVEKRQNRDMVLTDFVRHLIVEWEKAGREQQEIAELGGLKSKSSVAEVKRGTGVGAKTAPGFARAFGYPSVQALVDAAYEWRKSAGPALEARLAEPAVAEAMAHVQQTQAGISESLLRTIVGAHASTYYDGRDFAFWFRRLLEESDFHAKQLAARRLAAKEVPRARREARVREEQEWRGAAQRKHNVAAAEAEAERRKVLAEAEVAKLRKRRRIKAV